MLQTDISIAGIPSNPTEALKVAIVRSQEPQFLNEVSTDRYIQQVIVGTPKAAILKMVDIEPLTTPQGIAGLIPVFVGDGESLCVSLSLWSYATLTMPGDFTSISIVPVALADEYSTEAVAVFPVITSTVPGDWIIVDSAAGEAWLPAVRFNTYGFKYIAFYLKEFTAGTSVGVSLGVYSC